MTPPSIGVAAIFRDECNAMPGFLESAARFFDDVFLVSASPGATPSTDGTLDIIRKWGLPDPPRWDINEGFGAIRSRLLQEAQCDWTVIMDIDERMHLTLPVLSCEGTDAYPAVEKPNLSVADMGALYNQRELLAGKIKTAENTGIRAVRFRRRHWFDYSFKRPTQNFSAIPDWQMRCMKTRAQIGYTTEPKMHEQAWDSLEKRNPRYIEENERMGPFLDHYHCFTKRMEPEQRAEDIRVYDSLCRSETHTPIAR